MHYGTASLEEFVWVALALLAVAYSMWSLISAHGDLQHVLRSHRNGRYLRRARQLRRTEVGRLLTLLLFLLVGVLALFTPQPVGSSAEMRQAIFRTVLWFVLLASVLATYLDTRDRRWLRDKDSGPPVWQEGDRVGAGELAEGPPNGSAHDA